MSRRAAAMSLSLSPAIGAALRSSHHLPRQSRYLPCPDPHKRHCLCSHSTTTTSSRSSSDDDLRGLIDPTEASLDRRSHEECPVSAKDFTFLQEAIDKDNTAPGKPSDEAMLISNAIRENGNILDDETLKFLRQFRGKLNAALVIEVLRLVRAPEPAVRLFIWAGRQIGYSHTAAVYDALLETLGFSQKRGVPDGFLRDIGEDDRYVLGGLLNVLVRKCCRSGFWNEALVELGRLKDFGYKPSKATYNALVQVFLSADRLDSAFLVHREMSDSGFCLDRSTMGCFAYALCKAGRWIEALNIIEKEDYKLDTVLCTQMIGGLLEASLFEEAMSFLHRMRVNSYVPNVVTYHTLLSGFLRKKEIGWCKRIINMMITEGCKPDPSLFNSLVHEYCSSGDYSYAYKLLKKMTACGCRPGYATYNIFIGSICGNEELPNAGMLELAEKAYEEMLESGFVLHKENVGNLARCLCGAGKFDRAFEVIKEMIKKGFLPDTSTYTKVIDLLCQASKVDKAFLLFEEMKKKCVLPDVYTYTILIDSFSKVGLIQQARKWFDEMVRDGCTPNVVTYTALMHAYLKAKRLQEANDLFNSMLTVGCSPNVVTFTVLIDGLCKAGEIEKACEVYAKMRGTCRDMDAGTHFGAIDASTIEPNVFTYGALVDGLCKSQKVVEARDLLGAMSSAGCEPNHVVYDALIDGFCKAGKFEEAQDIFVRMSDSGYIPNVFTYSSLIDRLFKDRRLDLALKVLSRMLENSCAPNVITYTEMIDGLCKVGKTEEAYKLLTMMEEKGCNPNVVTYTAMIDGFGKAAKVDRCLELYRQMTMKGCAPNFITYRVLINHCCTAGLLDEAYKLLEEMKQTYWPKNTAGYRNVIEGFNKQLISSLGLLEELTEYSLVPIAPAYKILIDSFYKAGRLEIALELHKDIMSTSPFSDLVTRNMYASLIEALCLASEVEKALELYSEMTRKGYIPELIILFCLVKGLLKKHKWDEALQITYSIYHMDMLPLHNLKELKLKPISVMVKMPGGNGY